MRKMVWRVLLVVAFALSGGTVMAKVDTAALGAKIKALDGLSAEDKSALLDLLSEKKKYGLVWESKPEDVETQLREELPVFTEVKERALVSDAADAPNHILIEGDNLHALTCLSYTHSNQVDVIYIDPPYNTGNKDFVYNDHYVDKEDAFRHSKWLSFMEKRLKIAKGLLSDKGVIFISIDDNEVAQLKLLCDEIFGAEKCIGMITVVNNLKGRSDSSHFATCNEFLIAYAKVPEKVIIQPVALDEEEISNDYNLMDEISYYKPIPLKKSGKGWQREDRPYMYYPILRKGGQFFSISNEEYSRIYDIERRRFDDEFVNQLVAKYKAEGYEVYLPMTSNGEFGRWRWGFYNNFAQKLKTELCVNSENSVCSKMRATLEDGNLRGKLPKTTWYKAAYDTGVAGKHLGSIIGAGKFDNPKAITFLEDILLLNKEGFTILDFFAGSGTTLHAVMKLNAEDGGKRKCILVTNNENGICENVTYERNKRVIQGYTTPKGEAVAGLSANTLRYYKTEFVARRPTVKNRRALMAAAVDLLCVRNDVYQERKTFFGKKLKAGAARYFDDGRGTRMLVVFDEAAVQSVVAAIAAAACEGVVRVYVFAHGDYAYNEEFQEVADKVELCALPAAIENAYRRIIGKYSPADEGEMSPVDHADDAD